MRALIDGGFADLHHPEYWDLAFMHHSPLRDAYQQIVDSIGNSLDFFESMSGRPVHEASRIDFYASHEGLHLLYEQAQTRFIPRRSAGTTFRRTCRGSACARRSSTSAHVEFFRGIANPIGVKVGPGMDPEWLQALLEILNPQNQPGRLTLIHRFGAKEIERGLPPLIAGGARDGADACSGSAIRCTATPRPPPAA